MILKIYEDETGYFKNVQDAIEYIKANDFICSVTVYDVKDHDAYEKVRKIYSAIREYNKGKQLNSQILPTNSYPFRGIIGCLGVHCYEIGLNTYERNHRCIALFTGYNECVLDTSVEEADIRPSLKALSSMAMLSYAYMQH